MNKKKLTAMSIMLATMAVSSVVGGVMWKGDAVAEETKNAYALTSVFSVDGAELNVEQQTDESYVTAIELKDAGTASFAHNLAYEWREADTSEARGFAVKYFRFTFAFKTLDFKSVTLSMDSESAWATKDDKTTNKLIFTEEGGNYFVQINDDTTTKTQIALIAEQPMTVSFGEGATFGEFTVALSGVNKTSDNSEVGVLGSFTNIAGKYGEYVYEEKAPLQITAELPDGADADAKLSMLVYEINGQAFDEATEDKKIYDTAAPVLVVNEEFSGFTMGATFTMNYVMVDVLQDTNLSKTMEYYQYDPTDTVITDGIDEFDERKQTLTTSTIIFPMPYEDGGSGETTTVYKKHGMEFVSIRFTLGDKVHTGNTDEPAKAVYDLAWYTDDAVQVPSGMRPSDLWYIAFDRSEVGATYKYLQTNSTTKKNDVINEADYLAKKVDFDGKEAVDGKDGALTVAAKDVYAGANSYIYIPSLEWLFDDDNGYRNLKFTISYKAPGSTTAATSSGLAYNKLQLSVSKAGTYEFKVFAQDAEDNPMQYYLDGELVDVTADNVWDIEDIPYFSFSVKNQGLKVDDAKNTKRKYTSVLDQTYTVSALTVVGSVSLQSNYALYKVDVTEYNRSVTDVSKQLSTSDFSAVTYAQIADKLKTSEYALSTANGKYFDLYLKAYSAIIAENKDVERDAVLGCFEKIGVMGDRVNNETDKYEKFEGDPASRTFKTVEEGNYLVLADYYEQAIPETTRAAAYKLVVVETKVMTYEGETDWLQNNVVSIVLFSIAGVLLIIIIILLFVKPSDETLEDLDEKSVKKKDRKKKE
ncbi:MAG: hypothetical protein IJ996_04925 [Clostridia bacterium]|nr:hypothetical protein [Clostridia bacterium]